MPLTFAEAKAQYNPDPAWEPTRNSPEYYEILALMKQSGTTFYSSINPPKPKELQIKDILHNSAFKHPINVAPKPTPGKKYISKKEFLAIASNRRAVQTHMYAAQTKEQTIVDQAYVAVSKETICALKTQAQQVLDANNRIKKMSKQEFLNMADNREYVRQHILLNKK
jgi:hypothetical protein